MESSLKLSSVSKYENDLDKTMQITRIILRMIGVWPVSRLASKKERILIRLQNIICFFLCVFLIVPGFLGISLKESDFNRKVRMMGPLLNSSISCVKYILLMYHAKGIQSCLEQVRQDWRNTVSSDDQKTLLSQAKMGRKFTIFITVFLYIGGIYNRIMSPILKGRVVTPMNTTVRFLTCPAYFGIFDEQASPAYEIVFALQFFAALVTYSVMCGTVGMASLFVMHTCGQFSILIGMLQRLNDMPKPEDRAVAILLADIIEFQIKLKSFLKQVEDSLQSVWLLETLGSTILLCLTEYYMIMDWKNKDSLGMFSIIMVHISFTFSIFTNCYVGQLLTDQSVKVGLMTSAISWHRLPLKRARGLILVMAISDNPAKLSAGKMIELSLPTFSNIIKTSLAYFNLLRKIMT